LSLLQSKGISPTVVEYLKTPPTVETLTKIVEQLGLPAKDLLRRKEAALAGIDLTLPEKALIAAMVANPIAIERPIVIANGRARLGRPPEAVLEIL